MNDAHRQRCQPPMNNGHHQRRPTPTAHQRRPPPTKTTSAAHRPRNNVRRLPKTSATHRKRPPPTKQRPPPTENVRRPSTNTVTSPGEPPLPPSLFHITPSPIAPPLIAAPLSTFPSPSITPHLHHSPPLPSLLILHNSLSPQLPLPSITSPSLDHSISIPLPPPLFNIICSKIKLCSLFQYTLVFFIY
ncbi:uncharacterized protein LACBIDRAFT_309310 [Laccaria bicolor S238N-H82]|uniref:Predicted protein n=1 Tax=Laccaria bicolor (strain S238N-H82 / ATCC MYA-4686) TaxID=486041 RepID=B0CW28_LACBS|nr:uncharacterized protein LACBIDRAFT_309310 [Laccaria bicolor S238N-H82]EDR13440.1 predicted protein [Laccaria bicolor S238N-H82]|eukprot:XP_001875938.1 predicted protein [Laccaria bicolor S238N-H82]